MVYSLESFKTFINFIYIFLPVITLNTKYISWELKKDQEDTNYIDYAK
jgi:hypothetical protein